MSRLLSPSLLAWLRCFEATARHTSFTRAAEELCVTQGAVSQQVKQLEQWVGRPLLLRTPRALVLTPEGKWLGVVLRESLQAIESALSELRQPPTEQPIVLSCSPSFAMVWLTPRLGGFFLRHPQVALRVQAEFHALDRNRMANDGLEAAVRFDLGHYPDLHASQVLDEWLVPVASPAFLAAHPSLRTPDDLRGEMLLHDFSPWDGANPHQEWSDWYAQHGLSAPDMTSGKTYNLSMLAQNAALSGQGVALGHSALVVDELASGRLQPLFGRWQRARGSYFFACAQARSQRLDQVEDWLQQQADAFRRQRDAISDSFGLAPVADTAPFDLFPVSGAA